MTDDERPDDITGEEPAPLSSADEQWVVAQLRSLPPVEMPRDVQARLEAALAAEAGTAPTREGTAPEWAQGESGNVVPLRRRAPFGAALMRAAAGLLLVVGGVVAVGYVGAQLAGTSNDSADQGASTTSSPAAEDAAGSASVPVYASGTAYTEDSIATQASALTTSAGTPIDEITLAAAPTGPSASSSESASASAAASELASEPGSGSGDSGGLGKGERSLGEWLAGIREAATTSALPLCIQSLLTAGDTVLAVDAASFDQEPAYIVVGQGADSKLWYFAVRPTCLDPDTTDAVVLQFGNLDAG